MLNELASRPREKFIFNTFRVPEESWHQVLAEKRPARLRQVKNPRRHAQKTSNAFSFFPKALSYNCKHTFTD